MLVSSISIVIAVYNSEQSLPLLVARLDSQLTSLAAQYEVILVNDGSADQSLSAMYAAEQQYSWVRVFSLLRNYGQHNALLCGIRQARHKIVVTMDDDLQNPPEEIGKLLRKLGEGYDVVYGYPERESHGLFRNVASRITKISLQRAMGVSAAAHVSSFRAFHTEIRDSFAQYQGSFVSIDVLLGWGAGRFSAVPVANPPRAIGSSNYSAAKLIAHAVDMFAGFSTVPLQLASILGFSFALFGFAVLAYVVGRYFLAGGSVPGFPFLASLISIFAGVQLFALGIVGEYLARMHFRLMDKPSYVIGFSHSHGHSSLELKK